MSDLATLKTKPQTFRTMLKKTALSRTGDPPWVHSKPYIRVEDGSLGEGDPQVTMLAASSGGSINTYHTFSEEFVGELDGLSEALLNVERILDVLSVVDGDEWMEFTFATEQDNDGPPRAESLRMEGALNGSVALPNTETAFNEVPTDQFGRWNDDEEFLSPSGNVNATFVTTTFDALENIVDAVELSQQTDYYPVSVENGTFSLAVNEDARDGAVWGDLPAESVHGEDVTNHYSTHFEHVVANHSGHVELQTTEAAPGVPLALVQETEEATYRHVTIHVDT